MPSVSVNGLGSMSSASPGWHTSGCDPIEWNGPSGVDACPTPMHWTCWLAERAVKYSR